MRRIFSHRTLLNSPPLFLVLVLGHLAARQYSILRKVFYFPWSLIHLVSDILAFLEFLNDAPGLKTDQMDHEKLPEAVRVSLFPGDDRPFSHFEIIWWVLRGQSVHRLSR